MVVSLLLLPYATDFDTILTVFRPKANDFAVLLLSLLCETEIAGILPFGPIYDADVRTIML